MKKCRPFERTSKRRKGFPSETQVKRGQRSVKGGEKELVEKLGRNDPCPCGSGRLFQAVLPQIGPLSMAKIAANTGATSPWCFPRPQMRSPLRQRSRRLQRRPLPQRLQSSTHPNTSYSATDRTHRWRPIRPVHRPDR